MTTSSLTAIFPAKSLSARRCHLPDTMQLYSLRDTGIISLFDNGADANTVKGAADHHNLNITSIYCDHVDDNLVEKVRKHSEKF